MMYAIAMENMRAIAALMTGEFTVLPIAALLERQVEAVSKSWWLLEPEIGPKARTARMQVIRYRNAVTGEHIAREVQIPATETELYIETLSQVTDYSKRLRLEESMEPPAGYACSNQLLPDSTDRVRAMFTDVATPWVYGLGRSFVNHDLFSLWQAFEPGLPTEERVHYYPAIDEDAFRVVLVVATWGMYAAAGRGAQLFGLDGSKLKDWIDEHESLLRPQA